MPVSFAVIFFAATLAACGSSDRRPDRSGGVGATGATLAETTHLDSVRTDTVVAIAPNSSGATPARATTPAANIPATAPRTRPATPAPTKPPRDSGVREGAAAITLSQQGVDREIARAVAAWQKVRTLRATFQQTLTNPLTGSEMVARGDLQQQKPGRLAITFTEPDGDRIVSDGQYVWVYLQSATPGQVVKMRVTDMGAASTDLIGQFLNTPRAKYEATDAGAERVGDRPARAIVLVAKPGQALPFIRAKVWIDAADALIRQFEAVDANGISRRVRILTMSPNASVDAGAFRFEVPPGARVVER